ncbi:N-acetylmuramoyl-L-alanine amidase-like domain-containing protein [Marinifilum sp.]|uniref:N-acetylmuramoyl-L-alanine amidase-like domain-containing protein n=1 Tax=Marinifilum sp. TaxID=2033137 RepID=UPI003BAA5F23
MRIFSLQILMLLLAFVSCKGKSDQQKESNKTVQLANKMDQSIFNSISEIAKEQSFSKLGNADRTVEVGKMFLQTPYLGGTLETGDDEKLVVNLRELDCTTYLENVVVLSSILKQNNFSVNDFLIKLKELRYRKGEIKDYASRLHYFSDWIYENEQKGIVQNVTSEIGGVEYKKEINFMSNHVDSYAALKADSLLIVSIQDTEDAINRRDLFYIPEDNIQAVENKIYNGDLIAITTKIKGLDVSHVGIAIHVNDRLHLMHASSLAKKVVISDIPLYEMLKTNKLQSGIMVARVVD